MPDTVEQQAIAAVQGVLAGIASAPTLYLNHEHAIPRAKIPAVNLMITGSEPQDFNGHGVDAHLLNLVVVLHAAGDTAALRGEVRAAMAADHTLGNLVVDVNETECDIAAADLEGAAEASSSALAYGVLYWTRQGDPYTAGP